MKTTNKVENKKWVIKRATKRDLLEWNNDNDGTPFTQTREFAAVKKIFHWRPQFVVAKKDREVIKLVILERRLPLFGRLWYIPCGPTPSQAIDLDGLLMELADYGKSRQVFLLKMEPLYYHSHDRAIVKASPHTKPQQSVQPPNTMIISIADLANNLSTLGRRARRYARQAESMGVVVKEVPVLDSYCLTMYNLMQTANQGKGIPGQQTYEYYAYFWKKFHEYDTGALFFAYEADKVVAGAYIIKRGKTIIYKDGGSTADREFKGSTYYLHTEIMRYYAQLGFRQYDMWGMPPRSQINDALHPLHGVGQFKLAFSKDITEYAGCYDYDIGRFRARLWRQVGYRIATRIHHWRQRGNFW